MKFKVNQAVKVVSGKYEGMVGEVQAVTERGENEHGYRVHIEGVKDNEPVKVTRVFSEADLEANHGN